MGCPYLPHMPAGRGAEGSSQPKYVLLGSGSCWAADSAPSGEWPQGPRHFPAATPAQGSGNGVGKPADGGQETTNAGGIALVDLTVDTAQVRLFHKTGLDLQRS